jgi:hypothetical protein
MAALQRKEQEDDVLIHSVQTAFAGLTHQV